MIEHRPRFVLGCRPLCQIGLQVVLTICLALLWFASPLVAQSPPAVESPGGIGQTDLPATVRAAIAAGNDAFAAGDYQEARELYEEARKVVPDNLLVLVNLGLTEFYLGRPAEAEKFLYRAIQQQINLPSAWQVLGLIHLDARDYEKAMACFAQVVLQEPRNARARNYLGVAIGQMGWFDGAEAEFRRAVEFDPNYADAHFNLAYFALQRRQPAVELARRHYRRAIELGVPRDPELEKQFQAATAR
jgi:tetratricopeptide (TPR) repeat protein